MVVWKGRSIVARQQDDVVPAPLEFPEDAV
jgi:hypothetical protein